MIEAKKELPHGAFLNMIRQELPFADTTAGRLMKIANDPRIANSATSPNLPPSWNTLYELTKLNDDKFQQFVKEGAINSKLTHKQAVALHKSAKSPNAGTRETKQPEMVSLRVRPSELDLLKEIFEGAFNAGAADRFIDKKYKKSDKNRPDLTALSNRLTHAALKAESLLEGGEG